MPATTDQPLSPATTVPGGGFPPTTTRDDLLVLVRQWDETTSGIRDALLRNLLPNLDYATAHSFVADEAVTCWGGADAIRDGTGNWRKTLESYLTEEDRTGLEDAAELVAAESCARAAAVDAVDRALDADRDALARTRLAQATALVGSLAPPPCLDDADETPTAVRVARAGAVFDMLDSNFAAESAFDSAPRGVEIGPAA